MADIIRVDYQELQKVADRFGQQSEAIAAMLQAVRGAMDPLEGGGWVGQGSDAFFNEMNSEILPAVQRLTDALAQAQAVSKQINDLMQQADEEASTGFKNAAGAGSGGRLAALAGWLGTGRSGWSRFRPQFLFGWSRWQRWYWRRLWRRRIQSSRRTGQHVW